MWIQVNINQPFLTSSSHALHFYLKDKFSLCLNLTIKASVLKHVLKLSSRNKLGEVCASIEKTSH